MERTTQVTDHSADAPRKIRLTLPSRNWRTIPLWMDPATKPPLSVMSSVLPARIPRLAVKVQGAVEGGFQRQ